MPKPVGENNNQGGLKALFRFGGDSKVSIPKDIDISSIVIDLFGLNNIS
jgi:hypothetical protein